jgi:hypothetical protein
MAWQVMVAGSALAAAGALVGGVTWALLQAAKEGDREVPGDDFILWEQEHRAELEERMARLDRMIEEDRMWRNMW